MCRSNSAAAQQGLSEKAAAAKQEGNRAFFDKDNSRAIAHYSRAIRMSPTSHFLYTNRYVCKPLLTLFQDLRSSSGNQILLAEALSRFKWLDDAYTESKHLLHSPWQVPLHPSLSC